MTLAGVRHRLNPRMYAQMRSASLQTKQ